MIIYLQTSEIYKNEASLIRRVIKQELICDKDPTEKIIQLAMKCPTSTYKYIITYLIPYFAVLTHCNLIEYVFNEIKTTQRPLKGILNEICLAFETDNHKTLIIKEDQAFKRYDQSDRPLYEKAAMRSNLKIKLRKALEMHTEFHLSEYKSKQHVAEVSAKILEIQREIDKNRSDYIRNEKFWKHSKAMSKEIRVQNIKTKKIFTFKSVEELRTYFSIGNQVYYRWLKGENVKKLKDYKLIR